MCSRYRLIIKKIAFYYSLQVVYLWLDQIFSAFLRYFATSLSAVNSLTSGCFVLHTSRPFSQNTFQTAHKFYCFRQSNTTVHALVLIRLDTIGVRISIFFPSVDDWKRTDHAVISQQFYCSDQHKVNKGEKDRKWAYHWSKKIAKKNKPKNGNSTWSNSRLWRYKGFRL